MKDKNTHKLYLNISQNISALTSNLYIKKTKDVIINFFGDKDFGVITKRTNTYSLDLNDSDRFNDSFPTLKAYAVVSKTLFGKGIFEVENQFFNYNREIFNTLENAIMWIEETLKNN